MKLCDLHTHSLFSDGELSPEELVLLAKESGLSAVALTDHNTLDGLERFLEQGKKLGVETIAGVEISSEYNGVELHILALFLQRKDFAKMQGFDGKLYKFLRFVWENYSICIHHPSTSF